jgi:hypothetical protein
MLMKKAHNKVFRFSTFVRRLRVIQVTNLGVLPLYLFDKEGLKYNKTEEKADKCKNIHNKATDIFKPSSK